MDSTNMTVHPFLTENGYGLHISDINITISSNLNTSNKRRTVLQSGVHRVLNEFFEIFIPSLVYMFIYCRQKSTDTDRYSHIHYD